MLKMIKKLLRYLGIMKHKKIKKTRKTFRFEMFGPRIVTLTAVYPKKGNRKNLKMVSGFRVVKGEIYVRRQAMKGDESGECLIKTFVAHYDVPTIGNVFGWRKIPEDVNYVTDPELTRILFANLKAYFDDRENL